MRRICTVTGKCPEKFPCVKNADGTLYSEPRPCPYYTRTGLAEVIDWRERYEAKCREYDELLEKGLEAVVKVEAVPDGKVAVGPHFRSKPRRSKASLETRSEADPTGDMVAPENGPQAMRGEATDEKKCGTCWGFGLWGTGDSCPMGPMDASDGMPTVACPECGANPNPRAESIEEERG